MLSATVVIRQLASLLAAGRFEDAQAFASRVTKDAGALLQSAYVALQAPIAPLTWEVFGEILSSQDQSQELLIKYPRPVQLVAVRPVIRPKAPNLPPPGALIAPTLDDVLMSVVIDQERQLTSRQQPGTTANQGAQFVTASNLALGLPRLLGQDVRSPTPQFSMQFRWRQGPNVFVDCSVSVAIFARYMDEA